MILVTPTPEEKNEIVEYAKINGVTPTIKKYTALGFKLWPNNIKACIDPEFKALTKQRDKERAEKLRNDPEYIDKIKEYTKKRYHEGPGKQNHQNWLLKGNNKEIMAKRSLDWYKNNQDKILARRKHILETTTVEERREKHLKSIPPGAFERYADRQRERYKTDYKFKATCAMRSHAARFIKQASRFTSTEEYEQFITENPHKIARYKCTPDEFMSHIEKQFKPGMHWGNRGHGPNHWHLDHIKPLSTLKDLNDKALMAELNHYTNFQPLWSQENLIKGSKYTPSNV